MSNTTRKKALLHVSLDPDILTEFRKVANADHMEPNQFAALLISKFSDLKQGNALTAIAAIPKDLFKLRPGRITATPSASDARPVGMTAQHAV